MMNILIIGDFKSNTGPASVNKIMKKSDQTIMITSETGKVARVLEIISKIRKYDYIIFSGLSKLNLIGFWWAKFYRKKAAYLMHGSVKFEGEIEDKINRDEVKLENNILKKAPMIICVSRLFKEQIIREYPEYKHKVKYLMNPIDIENFSKDENIKKDENIIMSVGGGKKTKNILKVCEAINLLNEIKNKKYKLLVIGGNEGEIDKIKAFKFVEYIEEVSYEEMKGYYTKANLYIQNSIFETFGLAPIEALMCGTNILISNNVGCKDILTITNNNLILDVDNINEIADKILFNMNKKELDIYINQKVFNKNTLISVMEEEI